MNRRKTKPRHQPKLPITVILLVAGGLLLLLGAFWIWSRDNGAADPGKIEVQGRPGLKVDQLLIDYGEVKLGTPLSFRLTATNVGDQLLHFQEEPYIEVVEGC